MNNYQTTRLPIAAFLHCNNVLEFVQVLKSDDSTIAFQFRDPEGLGEQFEMDFEQGRAIVDARAFVSSERFLKSKMYKALRQGEN